MCEPSLAPEGIPFLIRAFIVQSSNVPVEVRQEGSGCYPLKGPGVLSLRTAVSVAAGLEGIAALKN
jgi:hypothetical protein